MPLFTTGQKLTGKANWKYPTAISPERRKATGRVKRPSKSSAPPNVSSTPANQNSESSGAVLPFGGMPMGNANSFTEPARMNMNAATMRSALRSCGAQVDHFATMLGAVMRSSPQSWIASYSEPSFYRHDERGWANSTPLRDRCLAAALQQASVSQALRPPGECVGGAAPLELGRVAEQRRVGPERRQILEEQR